jgi:hypothetical protein
LPVLALSPRARLQVRRLTPLCSARSLGERFKTHSTASFVDLLRLIYLIRDGPPIIAKLKLRGVPLGLSFKHSDAVFEKSGMPGRDIVGCYL